MKRIAALDVGSNKVVYVIGERDSYGDIHIIGVGEVPSRGIYKGTINNLSEAKASILKALKEAEEMAGVKVRDVIFNVSGSSLKNNTIKSQNEKETITISPNSTDIEEGHINRLIERCITKSKEDGYEIVYYTPRKFILDEQGEVKNPLGLVGSKLSAEVHIVKVSSTLIRNLEKAIRESGLNPINKIVSAIASANATLTDDEKEDGVLLLDIGGGLTDYTVYIEGTPIVTGVVPFGGNNITKDLSYYLKIDNDEAEKIKLKYGNAFVNNVREDEVIKIKPRGEDREIPMQRRNIADVIQCRVEEIIEKVLKDLDRKGVKLSLINAGVVITGGTANLQGIKDLVEHMTGLPARIGIPKGIIGLREKIENPKYSTVAGLLKLGATESVADVQVDSQKNGRSFKNLLERFWNWLKDLS